MDLQCGIQMAVICFLLIPRVPLLLLLLVSFPPNKYVSAIILSKHNNATDHASLLLFKSAISGDPNGVFTQWNNTVHFCQWHGVTCGHRHPERVVALQLPELDLVGVISPALANLTFLRMINLSSNTFHGQIPSELGNLRRLRNLDLSSNSLDGTIPSELSQCAGLLYIYFGSNMLGGYIPSEFGSPPSLNALTVLDLSMNQISGPIPPSIGKLSDLMYIYLNFNNLEGEIPPSFWNLSSLIELWLDANQLHGSLPQYIGQALPNLQILSAAHNNLHGEIPLSLSNASQLQIIQLHENKFSGTIPPNLGTLQYLTYLTLYKNHLEAKEPEDWNFLDSLHNCTILRTLELQHNHLGGLLPKSIANLSTNLQVLSMGDNYIQGIIARDIGNLVNLTIFDMGPNLLTGSIPASLGLLKNLHVLDLDNNNLSGQIPSTLGNLSNLNKLLMGQNSFNGSIPTSLGNCLSLESLDLSNNQLTGKIPKEVVSISTLSIILSFAENLLTGSIPWEVGSLINLGTLELQGNKLSGEIPISLGNCQVLQFLYLDRNFIHGSIPTSLSVLGGLQELDLSQNNLSGKVPIFLEDFHHLYYLNLSFNNFEGELPREGVFANTSAVSVLGNNRLCGGILMLHLSICQFASPEKKHKSPKVVIILVASAFIYGCLLFTLVVARYRIQERSRRKTTGNNPIKEQYINISYAELVKATNGFSESNLIGSGNFGSVYQGILDAQKHDTTLVAVKVFDLQQLGALKSFIAECDAFRNIRHRNLVKIITVCSSVDFKGNDFKAMVFTFIRNGSLESWLHPEVSSSCQPKKLNLLQRLNIAIDVASALDYLHNHCETTLIHCDLKPSNVLLDDDMVALVSDFGLARFLKKSTRSFSSSFGLKGTVGYIAPEYGMAKGVSTHGDVYSYGVLLLELFTGKRPTEDTFKEGLTLCTFVEKAFPERVMGIMDKSILAEGVAKPNNDSTRPLLDCVTSVLRIGLLCTKYKPTERMQMEDVTNELLAIRNVFLDSEENDEVWLDQ